MNEAETRAEHIDPLLAAAGWGVVEGSRIRREYPITLGRIEGGGKRGKLLEGLAEKGFGRDQLTEMQKIIDAEKSDLFDVLAHVAYALAPLTREARAAQAHDSIGAHFNSKQQGFLDFVLSHYVSVGVEELDQAKLAPQLRLKYHDSITGAVADLGKPEEIGRIFAGFQKYRYQPSAMV
jgi:type I restriction enzyme R subunit